MREKESVASTQRVCGEEMAEKGNWVRTRSSHEEEEGHRVEQIAHAKRLLGWGFAVGRNICSNRRHYAWGM